MDLAAPTGHTRPGSKLLPHFPLSIPSQGDVTPDTSPRHLSEPLLTVQTSHRKPHEGINLPMIQASLLPLKLKLIWLICDVWNLIQYHFFIMFFFLTLPNQLICSSFVWAPSRVERKRGHNFSRKWPESISAAPGEEKSFPYR